MRVFALPWEIFVGNRVMHNVNSDLHNWVLIRHLHCHNFQSFWALDPLLPSMRDRAQGTDIGFLRPPVASKSCEWLPWTCWWKYVWKLLDHWLSPKSQNIENKILKDSINTIFELSIRQLRRAYTAAYCIDFTATLTYIFFFCCFFQDCKYSYICFYRNYKSYWISLQ